MFELKTERLRIIPLNLEQLKLYREDFRKFEEMLGVNFSEPERFDDIIEAELTNAWHFWINKVEKNPLNYLWFTRWEIICKEKNKIIGSCGFKGLPNDKGEVEVGYMIKPSQQKKGFMSEALKELLSYAFLNHKVEAVIAETPPDNFPSQKVLLNNGFKKTEEKEGIFVWKLAKKELAI